jgi:multidrug efflux pump subunit AcrA (membrane-fusion protein)
MDCPGTTRIESLNMKTFNRRSIVWLGSTVLLLAALALAIVKVSLYIPPPAATGSWQTLSAEVQTLELISNGKVMPVQIVDIASPGVGVIEALNVSLGDNVKQGQALGRIASPELQTQLRTAEAALLRSRLNDGANVGDDVPTEVLNAQRRLLTAQTALNTAHAREVESGELYSKGIVSRNDDEAAKNAVAEAQMQFAQAKEELKATQRKFAPDQLKATALELGNKAAELAQIRERHRRLLLTAPLSGLVLYPQTSDQRSNEGPREPFVGARVAADESIMAIGDTSSFLVRATCTEAEFAWLQTGATAEVTLTALPHETFKTQVIKVLGHAPSRRGISIGEEVYEFIVALPAPGQLLPEGLREKIRIGGTAKLKVNQKGARSQTTVPVSAVVWAPDGSAEVRWRASANDVPVTKSIRIAGASLGEVLLHDELQGQVWVPAPTIANKESDRGGLMRLLGQDE